jgi:PEP-CTERM motif
VLSSILAKNEAIMKRYAFATLALSLLALTSQAQAQTITFNLDSDNDMALYVGNATGSSLRQVANQTTVWNTATTGSFTLLPGEDYFYMVGMNYGGAGDIGGTLNGISVTSLAGWVSKDVTAGISGFPVGYFAGVESFNPVLSEIQSLVAAGGFTTTPTLGAGAASTVVGGPTFILPSGSTATLFRQAVTAVAPEPGTLALLALGGLALIKRRRKQPEG